MLPVVSVIYDSVGLMDDETRQYLDGMMKQMNDQFERILNVMTVKRGDFTNTGGLLVNDEIVSGRRWLDLEERLTKVEDELRRRR